MSKIFKKSALVFIVTLLISSCVVPYKPELSQNDLKKQLVIEGRVTDEIGPFRVRLTRSDNVFNYQNLNSFATVTDALVDISDKSGNVFNLNYTDNGWYETNDKTLKGIPGNIYTLHITGSDGAQYESTPQILSDVPDIDSLYYQEDERAQFGINRTTMEKWLSVYLNTHDSRDSTHYFKWEFEETWEFNMPVRIEVHKMIVNAEGRQDSMYTTLIDVAPEKYHCWVTESSKTILVKSTITSKVGKIEKFPITSIGPGDDRLSVRYSIMVRQFKLSREIYSFLTSLREINENNGSIYDKIPAPVFGNISCCGETNNTLGYFFASGVKTRRIFINSWDVHVVAGHMAYSDCRWSYPCYIGGTYYYGTIGFGFKDHGDPVCAGDSYCADCRARGTGVKPDFWN